MKQSDKASSDAVKTRIDWKQNESQNERKLNINIFFSFVRLGKKN